MRYISWSLLIDSGGYLWSLQKSILIYRSRFRARLQNNICPRSSQKHLRICPQIMTILCHCSPAMHSRAAMAQYSHYLGTDTKVFLARARAYIVLKARPEAAAINQYAFLETP